METHKDWFTAIHEADHVVVFFIFEKEIPQGHGDVTIELDADSAGSVEINGFFNKIYPDLFNFEFDDELNKELAGFSQTELEAWLCTLLAGEAATCIETGRRDDLGSGRDSWSGDFALCMEFIERIFMVTDDLKSTENLAAHRYLETLFQRTVGLLDSPMRKQQLIVIAKALIEKRTLGADQCRQALNELMEPRGTSISK